MTFNTSPLTVVLFEPQIPQNTGNIARTCAAFKIPLVLIEPLGFSLSDKYLKRAGLDYWPLVNLSTFKSFDDFKEFVSNDQRIIGASTRNGTSLLNTNFYAGDILLFGREDKGLPDYIRNQCDQITTIDMPGKNNSLSHGVRSLNLSVSCAIVSFEAGKQLDLW